METSKKYLVGIYDDEDVLLKAVKKVRSSGVKIHECYTPFPIHGLDVALGHKRSRLPIAAFMFGLTGTTCAVLMISLMMGYDWPMIIGGKPFVPIPDLVPVSFELTVLFAALGMVATFLITNNLWPGKRPLMFDSRSTDNKFVMAVDLSKNKLAADEITSILKNFGATEVNTKQVEIK
ncbi:DUF3341 domain-containing protein [Rhodocytophaga rosea]|uniref:DUF3341 domain-containing protein n=1 Tax=Rhodocytophaga rosea TaxID=2704465 RepID=A0A6C0GF27_9BACT|nr:DUF3341 domain-containing protein [Rhodocytophaga rosea]QHT66611.1 DUF3341 domain-containing protein [Rhodocytophaga rosea]